MLGAEGAQHFAGGVDDHDAVVGAVGDEHLELLAGAAQRDPVGAVQGQRLGVGADGEQVGAVPVEAVHEALGVSVCDPDVSGAAGCVVDGSVRDTDSIRSSKLPVFSSAANPAAARYRYEIAEMNGPVTVRGCTVEPGDYVVADGDGICIVPFADVRRVVEHCETAHRTEIDFVERIDNATTLEELVAGLTPGTTPA